MNEKVEPIEGEKDDPSKVVKRQRSTIAFPYTDFESSFEIANAIHGNMGHGECTQVQLAAWTSQSVKSSTFRSQVAAAKLFALVEVGLDTGSLKLTELGRQTFDPSKERSAKAKAFLAVPLFEALYEKYKNGVTPPNAALEREIASLGVAEKQKAKARQVFENSAQQTGFREIAPNKLVMPATRITGEEKPPPQAKHGKGGGGGGDGEGDLGLDPLIMALLRMIPKSNESWPVEKRLRWFRTFAMNVSQVYDDDDIVELIIELAPQSATIKQNPSEMQM